LVVGVEGPTDSHETDEQREKEQAAGATLTGEEGVAMGRLMH
jgi:hypothetical protein